MVPECVEMTSIKLPEWHIWRSHGIGASEAAAAIGISPYGTPLSVYLTKTGQLPPVEESEAMTIGTAMEPTLKALYERRTGEIISESQIPLIERNHSFIRATLDAVTLGGRPVEFKNVGWRQAGEWGEPGSDEVPPHYLCQVHQQLLVVDADVADLAVLIGGCDFRVYTIERDPEIDRVLIDRLSALWDRIERRDPPPASLPKDVEVIAKLRPRIPYATTLGHEAQAFADDYISLGQTIAAIEAQRALVKTRLIQEMGEFASASLPDGRVIHRNVVERKEYTAKASSYVSFAIRTPKRSD